MHHGSYLKVSVRLSPLVPACFSFRSARVGATEENIRAMIRWSFSWTLNVLYLYNVSLSFFLTTQSCEIKLQLKIPCNFGQHVAMFNLVLIFSLSVVELQWWIGLWDYNLVLANMGSLVLYWKLSQVNLEKYSLDPAQKVMLVVPKMARSNTTYWIFSDSPVVECFIMRQLTKKRMIKATVVKR